MKYLLLLFSITLVACRSLPLEPFLSELQGKIRQRSSETCQKFPDQSFLGDCIREGDTISSQLTAAFRPIAGQEFQKLLENLDGRYYKQDPTTGLWYLPSQGKSNMTEDGIARNAEFLTHTLDVEFKKLLERYKAYVSSDEFLISNKLKKRWVGTLIRPGLNSIDDVVGSMDLTTGAMNNADNFAAHSDIVGAGVPKPVGARKPKGAPKPEGVPRPKGVPGLFPHNFKSLNHYDLLRVPRDATSYMITRAFWKLAKMWHPDKVPFEFQDDAGKIMRQLNEANEVLNNPLARSKYDDFLNTPRPNGNTQNNAGQNANHGSNHAQNNEQSAGQNANHGSNHAQNNEQSAGQNANHGSNHAQNNEQSAGQNANHGSNHAQNNEQSAGQNANHGSNHPQNHEQSAGQNAYTGLGRNEMPFDNWARPNPFRLRVIGFRQSLIDGLIITGVITGVWGSIAGLIFLINKLLPEDIVAKDYTTTDIEAETDVVATGTDVEAEMDVVATITDVEAEMDVIATRTDVEAEMDLVATSTDVEAETDVVATSTNIHSETPVVNISSQVCNGFASVIGDNSTGITYYLDPESCYYYYSDSERGDSVWFYG